MAIAEIEFSADSLRRSVQFKAIIPERRGKEDNPCYARPMKSLFLLHGYSGIGGDWLLHSNIVELAYQKNLCVIMPNGENSFYLDGSATGRLYGTYIGEELPAYVAELFKLSTRPEDCFIGGYSMGGFGAIHAGLRFASRFGGLFALSSALITHEVCAMQPGDSNNVANYDYFKLMFGEPRQLAESVNNPEQLVRDLKKNGPGFPRIYLACGSEDFLIEENRQFVRFLADNTVAHHYDEGPGNHNFEFWNSHLPKAVEYLLEA